ncbi:hypothetical protein ACQ4WX_47325 [Streptomyces lasalocidi]
MDGDLADVFLHGVLSRPTGIREAEHAYRCGSPRADADFTSVGNPVGQHLAFDGILGWLRAVGVPCGDDPGEPDDGRTCRPGYGAAAA